MKNKLSIIYYIFALIMFVAFVLGSYSTITYIYELVVAGSVDPVAEWLNVFIYYINAAGPYLAYSLISFGIGYMLPESKCKAKKQKAAEQTAKQETVEEVFAGE